MNPSEHAIDLHQHVWPEALIEALRARKAAPRLRRWSLQLDGEPDYDVDPADHDPTRRIALLKDDGLDRAGISLSSPLGLETLPADEAQPMIDAWHEGALAFGPRFAVWAAAGLRKVDPRGLERALDAGCVGLQLPASAIADGAGYDHVAPLLAVLEAGDRPLFVHPGPARAPRGGTPPPWWPAVVDYVAQMHAAWFAFRVFGRPRHPKLRVGFAMLAGLAPLHGERLAARGGVETVDERVFLETSSYGPRAIGAVVGAYGIDAVIQGSDRPYAAPPQTGLGTAADRALRVSNPHRFLVGH